MLYNITKLDERQRRFVMLNNGKSIIFELSIKVVKTKDVQKIIQTASKDPDKEVAGLPGITWNNSKVYPGGDDDSLQMFFENITEQMDAVVREGHNFIVLKIQKS